ncbi:hypothetical protein MKX08_010153 [Trichoderma sp. CBMAI-0020]|nr:hypothetical protein MKX08_010153 [Trichoderma sp. CBMAI-0020]
MGWPEVGEQPGQISGLQYQSSDILIQNSPSQAHVPDPRCHHQHRQTAPDGDHGQNLHNGEQHYHTIRPASTTSETPLTKNYVFEKQPRRKTRRDRYESSKSKDERVKKTNGKKSSIRVSKKDRLRSSREVMANFRSKAIANPGKRLTLEQKFTPGLFINGCSSASLADLVFNDIPLNHENVEERDKNHQANSELKQREKRNRRPDETKSFIDPLKRLIADYPPLESASRPTSTVVSSAAHTQRNDGDTPGVSDVATEAFNFNGTRVEDTTTPRDKISPISYFQPHQEAFPAANALSQRISRIVDDIPGETFYEYIERIEREILGADEPSARYIDKALFPAEVDIFDTREIGYRDRSCRQDWPHDFAD